jgi:hypothetical protein
MKQVRVILSTEAEEVYDYLKREAPNSKHERMILNSLNKKVDLIKLDSHYGDPMAKKLIPGEYKIKYGVTNLFRVELSNFWRMLYTLTNDKNEIEIIAFILEISDHDQYDKRLGYKRK